ncbi:CASP-like protein 4D1 [Oryza brachyantha]|uniref:CASP-like protein 4D1 n=1 Tax=Oryza brachyantha TaxID=4533 RepID=UPI0003EA8B2F|nr:CASP-like protein 4D1 [Oryza brachyantha]
MASSSRTALLSAVLALRLLTLALLAASLAVIAADKFAVDDDHKFTFKDVYAYRYVLAVAVVGCVYTLIQIPFAAVGIARRKGMIGGSEDVALFLVCADVVFTLLVATGAAAGLGFTYDMKRLLGGSNLHGELARFLNLAFVSAGLMLLAAAAMALVVMLSVYSLVR